MEEQGEDVLVLKLKFLWGRVRALCEGTRNRTLIDNFYQRQQISTMSTTRKIEGRSDEGRERGKEQRPELWMVHSDIFVTSLPLSPTIAALYPDNPTIQRARKHD
jgi:hypothetical protein